MFDKAVAAIKLARGKGFRVTINCTLFNGEDPEDVAEFFDTAMELGVEGITVSPGYSYHHAPQAGRVPGPQCQQAAVPRHFQPAPPAVRQAVLVVQSFRAVPGFSGRQPDLSVHAVEQSNVQHVRLAAALLPAVGRRLCADLQVPHRGHRVGKVRRRQEPALRQLHGALRIRGHGGQ